MDAIASRHQRRRAAAPEREFRFALPSRVQVPMAEMLEFIQCMEITRRAFLCEAALALMACGVGIPAVSRALNVNQSRMFVWLRAYRQVGENGLVRGGEIGWRMNKGDRQTGAVKLKRKQK
jgi:hypothetical protein